MDYTAEIKSILEKQGRSSNTIHSYLSQIKTLLKQTNSLTVDQMMKLPLSQIEKAIECNGGKSVKSVRRNVYVLLQNIQNNREVLLPSCNKSAQFTKAEFKEKVNKFLETETGSLRSLLVALCSHDQVPCSYAFEKARIVRNKEDYNKGKENLFYLPEYELYVGKNNHIVSYKGMSKWIDAYLRPSQTYLIENRDGQSMLNQAINDNIKRAFLHILNKNIGILDIKRINSRKEEEVVEEPKQEELDVWVDQARKIVNGSTDKQEILKRLRLITHVLI